MIFFRRSRLTKLAVEHATGLVKTIDPLHGTVPDQLWRHPRALGFLFGYGGQVAMFANEAALAPDEENHILSAVLTALAPPDRLPEIAAFVNGLARSRDADYVKGNQDAFTVVFCASGRPAKQAFYDDPDVKRARSEVDRFIKSGLAEPGSDERGVMATILQLQFFNSLLQSK